MEVDFDKEIDALLRQTARTGEAAFETENPKSKIQNPKSLHLDADEIAAFAENALPEKTKALFTRHFADCSRCRTILANVVALNAETQIEAARVEPVKIAAPAAVIPWYKRFFAAPNLAYAMGALLLLFGGLIAVTFLNDAPQTAEISRVSEKPTNMGGASSDGETVTTETAVAPSGAIANGNTSMMSNAAATANSMQANSTTTRDAFSTNASSASNAASVSNDSSAAKAEIAANKRAQPPAVAATPERSAVAENQAGGSNFAEGIRDANKKDVRVELDEEVIKTESKPAPKPAAPPAPAAQTPTASNRSVTALSADGAKNKTDRRAAAEKTETRAVGGKNFRRADGGVWYDASYNGQSATNVSRGTENYRKLDSGLRSIAESLNGTIVVVWKSRAYRIQ